MRMNDLIKILRACPAKSYEIEAADTIEQLQAENDKLKEFSRRLIMLFCWGYDTCLDRSDIQDLAEMYGLLEEKQLTVPCGDSCTCLGTHDRGQIVNCYQFTEVLK